MADDEKYVSIKCPDCGNISTQWKITEVDGEGIIKFTEDGRIIDDVNITGYEITCPHCGYWEYMDYSGFYDFIELNRV